MLNISEIQQCDLAVSVEVDPHIPIAVRTYTDAIGASFYRIGNFRTSLVEVPIDPRTRIVRGVKVVSLDCIGSGVRDDQLPSMSGLPVVAPQSLPMRIRDEPREITVSLVGSRFFIDWSNEQQMELKSTLGRLTFYLGDGALLGAAIENITETEARLLGEHIKST